uniref:Ubiquitin carboxyl-terminal hydrolase n=2 Tax=Sus scrofa TaxID=9823 RepID=A0A8D1MYR2_PIG
MGPVGLHNIGQTCCLNSLIQVLIMNVGLTKILKRMTVPRGAEEQRRNVPFQLLLLLEKMQDSRQKAVQPMELAYCLQKYNIPMFVQHDAAQLYLTVWNLIKDQITDVDLVSPRTGARRGRGRRASPAGAPVPWPAWRGEGAGRLEGSSRRLRLVATVTRALGSRAAPLPFLELRMVAPAAANGPARPSPSPLQVARLQALYTIRVKETFVCLECTTEHVRNSSMLTLPLSLFDMDSKPLKTLEDALHCFFQPRELSGRDKCFCENCGRKTCWKQVLKLSRLPQTLTLHLMRFSIKNLRTEKVCHSLYFPQSLDLNPLLETEEEPCAAEGQPGGRYELFAVIAHMGLADFGHYCAYVWSAADGKWFCFNDSNVCWVSWEDIQCTYGNHSFRWRETAYLLVYMMAES